MSFSTLWWIASGLAVGVELLTGTFYLLMLALGLSAGAIAAHLGAGATAQVVAAALVGGIGIYALYLQRGKSAKPTSADTMNLDIGQTVHVTEWDSNQSSTVNYRGAEWQAVLAHGATAQAGEYRIVEVVGSKLVLQPL